MTNLRVRFLWFMTFSWAASLSVPTHRWAQTIKLTDSGLAKRIDDSPTLPLREEKVTLSASIPGWELGAVSGVAVGANGDLYVIQRGPKADPILVFDQHGSLIRSWGKGDFTLPHSLRLDPHGNVWAIDAGSSQVIEYSSSGKKLLAFTVTPLSETGGTFRGATDLAFAPNGHLYLTDGYGNARVLEYTAKGSEVRKWGRPGIGPGEFHLPHAIQISRTGTVYVADRENGRIEKFNLGGKFLGEINIFGRCYALKLSKKALWATIGPLDQDPGAPGWLVELDPSSGRLLGHMDVPEQYAGHSLDLTNSKEPIFTAGSNLILFRSLSH